ncbi:MAG: 30S ribosomal protein S12 methylthiotransferase RimO [Gemmatimonadota bacterium]|nr:MAG: 30S ribosomal protein S12 methylthiotransferase RimO [Gemmatimonadota bacterium]
MKFSVITLGCDKNTVDSERMVATLVGHGADFHHDPADAEVLLVNTCGFIDAAKQESIDTLLEAARLKDTGRLRALVAVGCLVERYREELQQAIPEVDLFLGLRDLPELVPKLVMRGLLDRRLHKHPGARLPVGGLRHISYLKISEGCDHKCAFCAIPLWRGRHRSFDPAALVEESRALEARGVMELNLVAQDLAHYGRDLGGGAGLHELLERLLEATEIPWFRLLYIYSAGLLPSLVELIAREERIVSYIDMPIQHASPRMLELMRRPERPDVLRDKIDWLRSQIPDLTLRSTVVVGFPGETEEDFEALLEFVSEIEFDHLGAFAFSPQPGTPGAEMPDPVPASVKMERLALVTELQRSIVAARNSARIGDKVEVLVDGIGTAEGGEPQIEARMRSQAFEIDGLTYLTRSDVELVPGDLGLATVTNADDADVWAEPESVIKPARRPFERAEAVALDLQTAWGK